MMKTSHNIVIKNRKATYDYFVDDKVEAGIVLLGTEVKSIRSGRANLKNSYVKIKNGEAFVYQMHIGEYPFAYYENHVPLRQRKLLLHKYEIKKLSRKIDEKGMSLIPLKIYFKNGKAKMLLGVAKGKRKYDKRETIKKRDDKRDLERFKKNN